MSDNETNKINNISEKRRQLLKVSAATPLVTTLTLGAGRAAAVDSITCANKDTQPAMSNETDMYLATSGNDPTFSYVIGTRYYDPNNNGIVNIYKLVGEPALGNEVYLDAGGNSGGDGGDYSPADYDKSEEVYLQCLYDTSGIPALRIGPWPQHQEGSANTPLFNSCATSLNIEGTTGPGNLV